MCRVTIVFFFLMIIELCFFTPGMRLCMILSAACMVIGTGFRCISTTPPYVTWYCSSTYIYIDIILAKQILCHYHNMPVQPFKPSRCIKASFYITVYRLHFPITRGFMMKISLKLFYQYMAIFFNFSHTSSHLHQLPVENCDSNSRLVVDEMTMVNSGSKGLTLL